MMPIHHGVPTMSNSNSFDVSFPEAQKYFDFIFDDLDNDSQEPEIVLKTLRVLTQEEFDSLPF